MTYVAQYQVQFCALFHLRCNDEMLIRPSIQQERQTANVHVYPSFITQHMLTTHLLLTHVHGIMLTELSEG